MRYDGDRSWRRGVELKMKSHTGDTHDDFRVTVDYVLTVVNSTPKW